MPDRSRPIVGLERHASRIEPSHQPAAQDVDCLLGIAGNAQCAPEISACPERHHGELAARRQRSSVAEETVDDLVECAVPANRHHERPRLENRMLGDLGRLERPRRQSGFVRQAARGQPRLDCSPLTSGLARA